MSEPERVVIQVRAFPLDPGRTQMAIECTDCGSVAVVTEQETDETCLQHLEKHNVDTTPYRSRTTGDAGT